MNLLVKPKFHNRFDIVARNAFTEEIEEVGIAENIVLDRMYTRTTTLGPYFSQIVFGTGTGDMDPARTTLFNRIGNKACSTVELIRAFPVSKWTQYIRLEAVEFNGNILTEVGISETTTNVNTHALIRDSEGNPLSIEKTPTRIIDIYATVFVEFESINGEWYTTLRNYLAGADAAPPNTLAVQSTLMLCQPQVDRTATASTDAVAKTRSLTCQFNNYENVGHQVAGNIARVNSFNNRQLDIAVDRLVWNGVASVPVNYNGDMYYEYVVSEEEASLNAVFLPHLRVDNITEVKLNGSIVTDYFFNSFGEFNYTAEEYPYAEPIAIGTNAFWTNVIVNKYHYLSVPGTSGPNYGSTDIFSSEGFNWLLCYKVSESYARVTFNVQTKAESADAWKPASLTSIARGSNGTGFVFAYLNTTDKFLRINAPASGNAGGSTISGWQTYLLPIMKFTERTLNTGDILLIKKTHINEIPKGLNYLLNADATIQFGEGV